MGSDSDNPELVRKALEQDDKDQLMELGDLTIIDVLEKNDSISLHLPVELGAERCLDHLLGVVKNQQNSQRYLEMPNNDGETPLLTAVKYAQPRALKKLLVAGANINARDDNGKGVLHHLVLKFFEDPMQTEKQQQETEEQQSLTEVVVVPSQKEKQQQQQAEEQQPLLEMVVDPPQTENQQQQSGKQQPLVEMVDLLFSHLHVENLDVEPHAGCLAETPLVLAARRLQNGNEPPDLLKLLKKLMEKGASLPKNDFNDALRQKLGNPPTRSPSRSKAAQVVDVIFMDRSGKELEQVLKGEENNGDTGSREVSNPVKQRIGRKSLLFYAVDARNSSAVEVLMEFGADPREKEICWDELPLHRAAAKGHVGIFTMLLEKMKDLEDPVNLERYTNSLVLKLLDKNNDRKAEGVDHMKCFHLLLQKDVKLDVNQMCFGKTPLRLAAEFNNEEVMLELLRAGAFLGTRQELEKDGCTLWDIMPQGILPRAMDRLITQEGRGEATEDVFNKDCTLRLDYRFLIPPQQGGDSNQGEPVNEVETLMEICQSRKHRDAITHPLVKTLMQAKWNKAKLLHYINVASCFTFVMLLSVFVSCLGHLEEMEAGLSMVILHNNYYADLKASTESTRTTVNVMKGLLGLGCLMIFVREGFQIKSLGKRYLKNIDNVLDLHIPLMVLLLIFLPVNFTRHFAAWVIIFAWLEFMLMVGRAPVFALYSIMLRHVFWNYLKLMPLFISLIIGFTMSFTLILQRYYEHEYQNGTGSFWEMFPKTISMSMGELDYSSLSKEFPITVATRISAVLVFLVFVFVIIMVTMNVMNGVAVNRTQKVEHDAKLHNLMSHLELVFMAETFKLQWPRLNFFLDNIQFLSGSNNASYLLAEINKDPRRLLQGTTGQCLIRLDKDTAESLRCSRLRRLEEQETQRVLEEEKSRKLEESVAELKAMVHDLTSKLTHV
ncbi:hypothetical protein O3P69_000474 [Scylla paramamosain]|uniref:Ion transport domain-containing protein n=1 Tax=Scylla paramamosain TaxID=85552 RepID=A0AAW0UW21_SCYPA